MQVVQVKTEVRVWHMVGNEWTLVIITVFEGWEEDKSHSFAGLLYAKHSTLKFYIAFILCTDLTHCEPFFIGEETKAWSNKRSCKRQNKSMTVALFGPRSVFSKAMLFPLIHQDKSGIPILKSTSWYTKEAKQNVGHKLQWLLSGLNWPQKNVLSFWHK